MPFLLKNQYWSIQTLPTWAVVVVKRTPSLAHDAAALEDAFGGMLRALRPLASEGYRNLTDLREGPMRNDPEFETITLPYHTEYLTLFPKIAFLVRSAVGRQQMNRYNNDRKSQSVLSFLREDDALDFLELHSAALPLLRRTLRAA